MSQEIVYIINQLIGPTASALFAQTGSFPWSHQLLVFHITFYLFELLGIEPRDFCMLNMNWCSSLNEDNLSRFCQILTNHCKYQTLQPKVPSIFSQVILNNGLYMGQDHIISTTPKLELIKWSRGGEVYCFAPFLGCLSKTIFHSRRLAKIKTSTGNTIYHKTPQHTQ